LIPSFIAIERDERMVEVEDGKLHGILLLIEGLVKS